MPLSNGRRSQAAVAGRERWRFAVLITVRKKAGTTRTKCGVVAVSRIERETRGL